MTIAGTAATYDFGGRVALVTGGGSGLGEACVRRLAASDAGVLVVDLSLEQAQRVGAEADALGRGRVVAVQADVSDSSSMAGVAEVLKLEFGRLDCAVNSAGVGAEPMSVVDYDLGEWTRVLNVNLTGVLVAMQVELRAMLDAGVPGSVVNLASVFAHRGRAGAAAYVASKHAVAGLTATAALDVAEHGIRVNAVSPGFIETPMVTARHDEAARSVIAGLHPLNRLGTPDEIADAVVWLLSDSARFVTGAAYAADAGFLAR
ncbi:putative 3-oxoacyl-(acyl-carrier-protein) reductase [metagenome]|uniref:Putative 3-oxoacyl-(Acyl-carrier-protein) reductase n=1 Tax=metagenome TaxID=256318 RepID=A0A2P2CA75_9ZZZZ